ncbi:hypothetical protein Dsin_017881 [Dipteronia sinensis]|uniref:Uncharacterized protein n=1 Tax=Dipteronia sinensis TaxID=43782 RepID=A0AAE0AH87_9ROSI|nr:hypothetical protein Dsin_017881 [Dipteronia sinensis]
MGIGQVRRRLTTAVRNLNLVLRILKQGKCFLASICNVVAAPVRLSWSLNISFFVQDLKFFQFKVNFEQHIRLQYCTEDQESDDRSDNRSDEISSICELQRATGFTSFYSCSDVDDDDDDDGVDDVKIVIDDDERAVSPPSLDAVHGVSVIDRCIGLQHCIEDRESDESSYVRALQRTTNTHASSSYSSDGGDDDIDKRAEIFISIFRRQLLYERQVSLQPRNG